jgi:hypothetical protein
MPPHEAVDWSIERALRNGTLSAPHVVQNGRNSRPAQCCEHTCKIGYLVGSWLPVGQPLMDQSFSGRDAGMAGGRADDGVRLGVLSRLPIGCGKTFLVMRLCK